MLKLSANDFLAAAGTLPVWDVRSPAEYRQGHIPGAVNMPLFSDVERAEVGTLYKQVSPADALLRGLEIVGPKMAEFVRQAMRSAPHRKMLVYCWRGGQRSGSVAQLLRTAGFQVQTLDGGYKAYRNAVLADFVQPQNMVILGGKTGSGKTAILRELAQLGEQVIDLEAIAHHKGSSFGALLELPQPTTEHFENLLHQEWRTLDRSRQLWLEDESSKIGTCVIPLAVRNQMAAAPVVCIEIPQQARLAHLQESYAAAPKAELSAAIARLRKRLGGQHEQAAQAALQEDDAAAVIEILLAYYDKTYAYALQQRAADRIQYLTFAHFSPKDIAHALADR